MLTMATYIHVVCHTNLLYNERRNVHKALHGEQYKGNVSRTDPPLNLLTCILNLLLTTGAQTRSSP